MAKAPHVRWFDSISLNDFTEVGNKNASIGELSALLAAVSGRVSDGFALTAHAHQQALDAAGASPELRRLVSNSTIVDLGQVRFAAAAGCFATVFDVRRGG